MHALVVGGTGMLWGLTLHLAQQADHVTVVARRPERVRAANPGNLHPLAVDYRDADALAAGLREAIAARGPISLAVCWIHSTAPEALPTVVDELARPGLPFRLFHVRGSAVADPSRAPRPALPAPPAICRYRQVVLGFVIENGHSRWLTHEEISRGVIAAVEKDAPETVVGTVRPWHRRP